MACIVSIQLRVTFRGGIVIVKSNYGNLTDTMTYKETSNRVNLISKIYAITIIRWWNLCFRQLQYSPQQTSFQLLQIWLQNIIN